MKASICLITYNHEQYINAAIESLLKQRTDFKFEIIIGEDFSTDNTRNICIKYAEEYPGSIKLIPASHNVGPQKNFYRTYEQCKGNYIAFIEGDDYWIDPLKLQKQIDFLQSNPGYSACFHNVLIKSERAGSEKEWIMHADLEKDTFSTEDILGPWFIASPSFVFVNYPDFILPDWFFNCTYGDLPMMLLLSLRGKFKYLPEVMAVYRLHDKGFTTVHVNYDKIVIMIYIYQSFNIHTNYKFKNKIRESVIYEITRHLPVNVLNEPKEEAKKTFAGKIRDIINGLLMNIKKKRLQYF